MDGKGWRLPFGVDFLAILAPALYFTGYCYYWGFCDVLGLDIKMMEIPYDKMLLASWTAFALAVTVTLFYILIWHLSMLFSFPLILIIELVKMIPTRMQIKRVSGLKTTLLNILKRFLNFAFPPWYRQELAKTDFQKIALCFVLFAILGVTMYFVYQAQKQGMREGKRAETNATPVIVYLDGGAPIQGKYISTIGNKVVLLTTSPEGVSSRVVLKETDIKRRVFE